MTVGSKQSRSPPSSKTMRTALHQACVLRLPSTCHRPTSRGMTRGRLQHPSQRRRRVPRSVWHRSCKTDAAGAATRRCCPKQGKTGLRILPEQVALGPGLALPAVLLKMRNQASLLPVQLPLWSTAVSGRRRRGGRPDTTASAIATSMRLRDGVRPTTRAISSARPSAPSCPCHVASRPR